MYVHHHFFPFSEYSIIWWFRPCKLYIFWKHITLATRIALFWPSTTKYHPAPNSTTLLLLRKPNVLYPLLPKKRSLLKSFLKGPASNQEFLKCATTIQEIPKWASSNQEFLKCATTNWEFPKCASSNQVTHFRNSWIELAHFGNSQFVVAQFRNSWIELAHFGNSWFDSLAYVEWAKFEYLKFKKTDFAKKNLVLWTKYQHLKTFFFIDPKNLKTIEGLG